MQPLENAILRTVAYFDLFDYPLTSWEVWKWLFSPVIASPAPAGRSNPDDTAGLPRRPSTSLGTPRKDEIWSLVDVVNAIETSAVLKESIDCKSGFVFLRGRSATIKVRQERYRLALLKLDRARAFTRTLQRLPFVQAVFACNSLGLANARAESDIDFFIIVQRGHVWVVRLLAAGWAKLRKLRPMPGNRQDKFCLSFFLADSSLDLAAIRLPQDPYLGVWLATLMPLADPNRLGDQLWQANPWASQFLPNAQPRGSMLPLRRSPSPLTGALALLFGSVLVERLAAQLQLRVLAPQLRALANHGTSVVLDDRMLKFHDNDRRQAYADAYAERARAVGVPV